MEPERAERDFDSYIGTRQLSFCLFCFWDENPATSIFSMRGIRWFQQELLQRLIYTFVWRLLFLGFDFFFGLFWGPTKNPTGP